MKASSLVVGLGNPGAQYAQTRHNIGQMAVDELCRVRGLVWRSDRQATVARLHAALVAKPDAFMNLSGSPVHQLARRHDIGPARILIVVDCLELPVGRIRLARGGGSAGQKGMQSIIDHLGTKEFPRLRLGIGRPTSRRKSVADFVLERFSSSERDAVQHAIARATQAIEMWVETEYDIDKVMNRFN